MCALLNFFGIMVIFAAAVYGNLDKLSLLPDTKTCGKFSEDKIIGGQDADLGEFPWIALLEYDKIDVNRRACHGSLINSKYVLTVAHCIKLTGKNADTKLVSVRLGEYDITSNEDCLRRGKVFSCAPPPINVPVEKTIVLRRYTSDDKNRRYDIGLIRLKYDVDYTEFVHPGCLPLPNIDYKAELGQLVQVSGWGTTSISADNKFIKSNIKLKVEVPLRELRACSYKGQYYIDDTQLCAGSTGKDSCIGDSGAPLMIPGTNGTDVVWTIIGLVSFGSVPCGTVGVYSKVSAYMDWILQNIEE